MSKLKDAEDYIKYNFIKYDPWSGEMTHSNKQAVEAIKQAQLDAWNAAVKECAENAEVYEKQVDCTMNCYSNLFQGKLGTEYIDKYETVVDEQSILKLLKE